MEDNKTDVLFTYDKLDVQAAVSYVTSEACGAISLFMGTTRDATDGRKVVKLEYEYYEEMAHKEAKKICVEIREKWDEVKNIVIHHRLGSVPVTESSIIIAVSSPRRADAMAATKYCIDRLKARVPIWKKEVFEDGMSDWMENKECAWRAGSGNHVNFSGSG